MKIKMKCPVCRKKMKVRYETVPSDNFVSGKEEIIDGWDCECGIHLDMYED